jgi:predicted ester cyclase
MTGDEQQFSSGYMQIWSEGKYDLFDKLYSPDYESRTGSPFGTDRSALRKQAEAFRSVFSNVRWEVAEQYMDGDMFVILYLGEGKHTGEFMGTAPTNKQVRMSGASFMRIKDGKVVESWEYFDTAGMMQQLGMMPTSSGDA